ncbi:flagellar assembly protein FliW [Mangrovihabitans endophyticus]|nr:flagellar assembly protein FliW [Mangrovihabitans endophyticus]
MTNMSLPTIHMAAPMPGFPAHQRFVLVRLNDEGLLYAFTSIDNPELRFLVVPPEKFFDNYTPEIPDEALALLGYPQAEDLLTMLVITAGRDATSANLMAPIVINQVNRMAVQVVLTGSGLPVRAILQRGK